ncbi:conserved hypothetical protein [Echinococcus multilocularis]|uniref:Uncharacterized protein n=1 Tax=Echinococcus multilocularis TaxID=6211 RepID=A0A087VZR0_ECHMU|nr:conserved hypothetical protein [Echinococcus multilocularis]
MLCFCPPTNTSNSLAERSDFHDSEETGATSETARLTVHEDDVEFFWPLAHSICYPVWQAACVLNTPFYPYPLVRPIEEANVVFKNMMFERQRLPNHIVAIDGFIPNSIEHEKSFTSLQKLKFWADPNYVAKRELALLAATVFGEDTRRSSELTTPFTIKPKGASKTQAHILKDEMVLASKSLMELDATCDKRVGAQLQGIGRRRGTKVVEKVKTKISLILNFEQKIRKKRPDAKKLKSESTESFAEVSGKEDFFTDDEMNSALLLLEHHFGSRNRMALRISEALNRSKVASRKIKAYLGEESASIFLRTITKPRWLMTLLSSALGSAKSALEAMEIYRRSKFESDEYKDAAARLIEAAGNENFVKAFVQKFAALKETVINSLRTQLEISADEVDQIIVGCLGGAKIPMRRMEGLTGAKVEVIQGLLNALKRCEEEELETYLGILRDCITGKLKSDEEAAKRLARIQKRQKELEYQIQKHQQGLQEYRHRRRTPIIITVPTAEPIPGTIEEKPPEPSAIRQEKRRSKKKSMKVAITNIKVDRAGLKESTQKASVKTAAEVKKAEEEVEESIDEEEKTLPFFEFIEVDELSSQITLTNEIIDGIPTQSPSFTGGSVLSMEVADLVEDLAVSNRQASKEPSQFSDVKGEVAKFGPSKVTMQVTGLTELPSDIYFINKNPGDISEVLRQSDISSIDTRLSKRVEELKRAVACEGFLEPYIGLEPNRIVLVLVRSAINAKAVQLLEMIDLAGILLKHFLVLESVRETVRHVWDLLYRKIVTEMRTRELDAGDNAIYLEVGRRIIKQLKQLGVNTYHYLSDLQVSMMRKSITDSIVKCNDPFPKIPVVPNVDIGELLLTTTEASRKSLSSYGQIIQNFRFAPDGPKYIKEALEEAESTYSMSTPSSSDIKRKSPAPSSTDSFTISVDLPLAEKQSTITEGEMSAESSESEVVWLPRMGKGIPSTSTAAENPFVDVETFEDVPEDMLAKRLYEAYGGELQETRSSLMRMAEKVVENPAVLDVVELRSSQGLDLESIDAMELGQAMAKIIQRLEDEEEAARLMRASSPEIEEVETLETPLERTCTQINRGRSRKTEEESPGEIGFISLTPPLPPYRVDVVKYQLQNIIEELEMSQRDQQDLNTLERILWITMPEKVAYRYELFMRVADLQRRGQFTGEALKVLLESVLVEVTDLYTLLDPDFEIEDEQRFNIYDQLRTNLDVLCWFKLDVKEYEKQLQEYPELMQFGGTLFPGDFEHPILLKNTEEESFKMSSEPINETIQFAPLSDSLTEEIKERLHDAIFERTFRNELVALYKKFKEVGLAEHSKQLFLLKKNFEGEIFYELSPTQKQTNKLEAFMKWRKRKIEMAGTTARCLFLIMPEIVDQDREVFLEVITLIDVHALSAEVATLFVSSTFQDLLDLMLIALNKDDFQKDERQMAYNQCRAMMEVLQCFSVPIKEFTSNFDYCTDLEDQYKEIFADGKFPTIGDDCEFFVELPQAYIQELPFEVLDAVGGRLRIEESEREPLKSYLEHTDSRAFVDQDKYDFERTRALAVHSLRLHPQDVNEIVKHKIEVLEKKKLEQQEGSKAREAGATDVERVIDRWLSFRASANQASTTSSPLSQVEFQKISTISKTAAAHKSQVSESGKEKETSKIKKVKIAKTKFKELSEEGLTKIPVDRGEVEAVGTILMPSAEVLSGETKMEGEEATRLTVATYESTDQQKEPSTTVDLFLDEVSLIRNTDTETERPRMKKLYTSLITPKQQLESISEDLSHVLPGSTMRSERADSLSIFEFPEIPSIPVADVEKDTVKLLEKNEELEIQREKSSHHLAAMEAAKRRLSVIYERLADVSATAKRKAYDRTSRLRQEEEEYSHEELQARKSEESEIATSRAALVKESLKAVSRISRSTKAPAGTKEKKINKRSTAKSAPPNQPPVLPSIHPPTLQLKVTKVIEGVYSASPLSLPPPSGSTKLPPLWLDQQKRWRDIFLRGSESGEVNVPKAQVITTVDMTIKNIQPLKLVRARKRYVDERASNVARVTGPVETMIESAGRRSRAGGLLFLLHQAVIRFLSPSMISAVKKETGVVEWKGEIRNAPRVEDPRMEANHHFITDKLRINLILKKLRMQLSTHDLVEVMIDLHTGRASKKTRDTIEAAYETIKDQKYTHLSDEAAEKCRPQCRPNDVPSVEWKRIGADVRSAHPFDEFSFPGYFTADSMGDGKPAHCEQEKMVRLGAFRNDLTFDRISRRANIIGRVRTYVQERSYTRIKKSLAECIQVFNSRLKNEEPQ